MLDVSFGARFVPAQSKHCRLDSGTCRAEFPFSQASAPAWQSRRTPHRSSWMSSSRIERPSIPTIVEQIGTVRRLSRPLSRQKTALNGVAVCKARPDQQS